MKKWIAALALLVVALVLVHTPPKQARAQAGGSGVYDMGEIWNGVAPSISAGVFTTPLRSSAAQSGTINPYQVASTMTIAVSLKVTGVLYVSESDGTTTQVTALNGGTALTAFQDYTFTRGMRSLSSSNGVATTTALRYNFQLGTNGGINYLRVQEILGPVD